MGQGDFADEVQKEEDEEESEEDFVAITDHDTINMKSQEMIEEDESPLTKQLPEAPLIDLQTQAINF